MTEPRTDQDRKREQTAGAREPIRYPLHHVVSIVESMDDVRRATTKLKESGFLASELEVVCGIPRADELHAATGRTGLADLAIRLAERFGIEDEELETKHRYEKALRDGHFIVMALTPTQERKTIAANVLREHGAHYINYFDRFSIEVLQA